MTKKDTEALVWIFGYGSLIWDSWETPFGCTQRVLADLPGYRRAFNKASIKRWGSKANPGPTLNVVSEPENACRGIAFAFPVANEAVVRAYLTEREGEGFPLREREIGIVDGSTVLALVPIYEGKNVIVADVARTAEMACLTSGSAGPCVGYVRNVAAGLTKMGIDDPAVTELVSAIERRSTAVRR